MKKSLILALVAAFCFSACEDEEENKTPTGGEQSSTTQGDQNQNDNGVDKNNTDKTEKTDEKTDGKTEEDTNNNQPQADENGCVKYTHLGDARTYTGGSSSSGGVTLKTKDEASKYFTDAQINFEIPSDFDFSKNSLLVLTTGMMNHGGYSIGLEAICKGIVRAEVRSCMSDMTTQALEQVWSIYSVPTGNYTAHLSDNPLFCKSDTNDENCVSMTVLAEERHGEGSEQANSNLVVIKSKSDFDSFATSNHITYKIDESFDFTTKSILAIGSGMLSHGGYTLNINKVCDGAVSASLLSCRTANHTEALEWLWSLVSVPVGNYTLNLVNDDQFGCTD